MHIKWLVLYTISLCTTFQMPVFACSKDYAGFTKIKQPAFELRSGHLWMLPAVTNSHGFSDKTVRPAYKTLADTDDFVNIMNF